MKGVEIVVLASDQLTKFSMIFFVILNIKEDTFKNDNNQFVVPVNSNHSVYFHTMEVMRAQQLCYYQYCSKYIILHSTAEGISYRFRTTTEGSFLGELFL